MAKINPQELLFLGARSLSGNRKYSPVSGALTGNLWALRRFLRHASVTKRRIQTGVIELRLIIILVQPKMKLQIDNLDGLGPVNYTSSVDGSRSPQIVRKLNQPSELRVSLVANAPTFVVPVSGARIILGLTNGQDVFSGYLMQSPVFEYLGWGERGPVYRYDLVAQSDEVLLDEKRLPDRCPFLDRSAGNALRQLTEDLLPGVFDTQRCPRFGRAGWVCLEPAKDLVAARSRNCDSGAGQLPHHEWRRYFCAIGCGILSVE